MVPECRATVEEFLGMSIERFLADRSAWFDLYDLLSEFNCAVLLPELRKSDDLRDSGLLLRCFEFVEILLNSPVESISAAAYFQNIETLFSDEQFLVISFPVMRAEARRLLTANIDPSRISEETLRKLKKSGAKF
jgi:hypothetical protein